MAHIKQIPTKNSGFTLIEAIVTIIIMLFLMGIILSGLNDAKQRFLVRDSAQQFADVIRQAINDTKNGIKVKDINCVPNSTVPVPRECSNYKIRSTSNGIADIGYDKYVETTDSDGNVNGEYADSPMNHSLQVGTAFLGDLSLSFIYSSGTFPLVSVGATGAASVTTNGTGTIQMTIKSLSNGDIRTNICILKSGSVLIQMDGCS